MIEEILWLLGLILTATGIYLIIFFVIKTNKSAQSFIKKHKILYPNSISAVRCALLITDCIIGWYFVKDHFLFHLYMGFYMFLALADSLDGVIARKCDLTSQFGEMLDPLADKISYIIPFIFCVIAGYISIFIFILFVLLETINQFPVRNALEHYQKSVKAKLAGKIKTPLIYTYLGLLIIIKFYVIPVPIWCMELGMCFCALLSFMSAYHKLKPIAPVLWKNNSIKDIIIIISYPNYFKKSATNRA